VPQLLCVDYFSPASQTTLQAFKAAGVHAVCRYYVNGDWTRNPKALKDWEVTQLLDAGIDIFPVYETNPVGIGYFSEAQGRYDALMAVTQARAVGQPRGSIIYFAVDFDLRAFTPEGGAALTAYCDGLDSYPSEYQYGLYGGYYVCRFARERRPDGIGKHLWQTIAWSYGNVLDEIDLYQYQTGSTGAQAINGVGVDYDYAYVIGNWREEEMMTQEQFNTWFDQRFSENPEYVNTTKAIKGVLGQLGALIDNVAAGETLDKAQVTALRARIDRIAAAAQP
jgi:hypothetical protein